jgi:hypothetical protein
MVLADVIVKAHYLDRVAQAADDLQHLRTTL